MIIDYLVRAIPKLRLRLPPIKLDVTVKVVRNIAPYPLVPVKTGAGIRVEKNGGNALDICPGLCHHIKC